MSNDPNQSASERANHPTSEFLSDAAPQVGSGQTGSQQAAAPRARSNLRFTIAGLMMVMLIFSVMAAAASYLWQARDEGTSALILFFPFVLISPMGLMIVVSWARQVLLWINRR